MESLRADQRERRDRIVDAAVEMLGSVDYAEIQVKAIASRADVALGTLYRYFSSKDHLMAEALVRWASAFPAAPVAEVSGDIADRLKSVYGRAAAAFERQPFAYSALAHLQATADPLAAEQYVAFTSRQSDRFAAVLHDLPAATRADVVAVMDAILNQLIRSRQAGTITRDEGRERLARAADLVARGCG